MADFVPSSLTDLDGDLPESRITGLIADLASRAPLDSPALTGTPTTPTAAQGTNTPQVASTAFVRGEVAALVAAAPTALDTLNELAVALGNDASFAATMTTALGGKQPLDAELTALAGLASAADRIPYFTGSGTAALATFTGFGRSLVDDVDAAAARATLGLGTIATAAAGDYLTPTGNGSGLTGITESQVGGLVADLATLSAAVTARLVAASNLSDVADAATARSNLGLAIGSNVQAWDADLDTIAALAKTKGNMIAASGSAWAALAVGTDGQVLTADAASPNGVKWAAAAGGGGSPGGSTGQIQYNNGGAFGGVSKVTVSANGNAVLAAQTTPGSVSDGELYQGTQKTLMASLNGMTHFFVGCLFTQTADATVANTTTETTVAASGVGTLTLPANFLVAGKTLRVRAGGYLSANTGGASLTLRIKLGSVSVGATGSVFIAAVTNAGWDLDFTLTCRTAGASGTVIGQGVRRNANATGSTSQNAAIINTATVTVDTTASAVLAVLATWNAANANNTITCTNLTVEVLN